MATYRVETSDGIFEVETEEPVSKQNPIDSNFARQDQRMKGRSDLLKGINPLDVLGARGAIGGLRAGAQLMGGLSQRATAAGVNPLIAAQRAGSLGGMFNQLLNPMQYGEQIKRGLTGEQLGELGDVYVGAGMGENSAALAGLGTELMLTAPEAILNTPKLLKSAPSLAKKAFDSFRSAPKLGPSLPSSEQVGGAIKQLESKISEIDNIASLSAKSEKEAIKNTYLKKSSDLKTSVKTLKGEIENFVDSKALEGRGKYFDFSKNLNDEFAEAIKPALKDKTFTSDELSGILEEIITNKGLRETGRKLSTQEKEFLNYADEIASKIKTPTPDVVDPITNQVISSFNQEKIHASDFYEFVKKLGSKSYGKSWDSGQRIVSDVNKALNESLPELAKVRGRFAEKYKTKEFFQKIFDPFNRTRDLNTARPSNYLEDIISELSRDVGITGDEARGFKALEEHFGADFTGALKDYGKKLSELNRKTASLGSEALSARERSLLGITQEQAIRENAIRDQIGPMAEFKKYLQGKEALSTAKKQKMDKLWKLARRLGIIGGSVYAGKQFFD